MLTVRPALRKPPAMRYHVFFGSRVHRSHGEVMGPLRRSTNREQAFDLHEPGDEARARLRSGEPHSGGDVSSRDRKSASRSFGPLAEADRKNAAYDGCRPNGSKSSEWVPTGSVLSAAPWNRTASPGERPERARRHLRAGLRRSHAPAGDPKIRPRFGATHEAQRPIA